VHIAVIVAVFWAPVAVVTCHLSREPAPYQPLLMVSPGGVSPTHHTRAA
jgi:hypothetical protein